MQPVACAAPHPRPPIHVVLAHPTAAVPPITRETFFPENQPVLEIMPQRPAVVVTPPLLVILPAITEQEYTTVVSCRTPMLSNTLYIQQQILGRNLIAELGCRHLITRIALDTLPPCPPYKKLGRVILFRNQHYCHWCVVSYATYGTFRHLYRNALLLLPFSFSGDTTPRAFALQFSIINHPAASVASLQVFQHQLKPKSLP